MPSLLKILAAADETQTSPRYQWDNNERKDSPNCVLQLTLSGECHFWQDGQETRVRPGQAMFFAVPSKTRYGYPNGAREPYRLRYVCFNGEAGLQLATEFRERYGSVLNLGESSEPHALLREIVRSFGGGGMRDRFHESELLYQLLMALFRHQSAQLVQTNPVEYCHHYMHNHHRGAFNLKRLAEECGTSREHLTREFRRRYGVPPATYLRELRLRTARELLSATRMPLDEVARASGLADARTLCRLFRQHFHTTPESVRRGIPPPLGSDSG